MEYTTLQSIISIATLLLGGGGGAFFTWRFVRKRAKAEAQRAEVDAAKELQDVYQQLITDIKADRDEQKAYIKELKDDRLNLRNDRDQLKTRQEDLEREVRQLKFDVARQGRMTEAMRPFLCGRKCSDRTSVDISLQST